MNKKIIIGGIAVLSMSVIIGWQASASMNKDNENRGNMEQRTWGKHFWSGEKDWSGERQHIESGDKEHLGSWFKGEFGSWFHFGSGEKGKSGDKEHLWSGDKEHFGTGTYINSGTKAKINTTKIAKKSEKISKKIAKKASKKK